MRRLIELYRTPEKVMNQRAPSGIPRSKTRGLRAPGAKTAKIWPGHILKLESVPNAKSPKNLTGGGVSKVLQKLVSEVPPVA